MVLLFRNNGVSIGPRFFNHGQDKDIAGHHKEGIVSIGPRFFNHGQYEYPFDTHKTGRGFNWATIL